MKTLSGYIHFLRRQPKHLQHVHAFVFSGIITVIIAGVILYTDYGFWHERYQRSDDIEVVDTLISSPVETIQPASPGEMWSRFWTEAKVQFSGVGSIGTSLLEGKETYTKDTQ